MKKHRSEKRGTVARSRKDPLIDEVRRLRSELSKQFDHDLGRLCDHLREVEASYPGKVVRKRRKRRSS